MLPDRAVYGEEHGILRQMARRWFADTVVPNMERWDEDGIVPRAMWKAAGAQGLLCPQVPEIYGGAGGDFRYNAVIDEELAYTGSSAFGIACQNDLCVDYILHHGTEDQRRRWLPGMVAGDVIACIAMTEPGTGSDLAGVRTRAADAGDHYVVSGQKTFITNGIQADLTIAVVSTDAARGAKGISLLLIESDRDGFRRGRKLEKIGMHGRDTAELFFDEIRVPKANRIGGENEGFRLLMTQLPQERLSIAIECMGWAQKAYDLAAAYVKERRAFGRAVVEFQNTRFQLAQAKAELAVGWAYLDQCIARHAEGRLTVEEAAIAKLWITEMYGRIVDMAVQMHGGYGFMKEYLVARMYCDARVQRIYGGTSEIMRDLIGRTV
ncbi:MAG: hypothetical protein RLY86_509 [Pseudomonadota bacterium]|jgi:alkylation response protein AidB-like acyl-CoA dehydrogenase